MFKTLFPLLLLFVSVNALAQSFNSVWNTSNIETGSSATDQVTIPTNPTYTTYNYDIDWGDGTSDTGVTGTITHTYLSGPGTYTISISGAFPAIYFNDATASDKLKIIKILQWGTVQWQSMEDAFRGCRNLNFDAIDVPDLSQVTSLQNMFRDCSSFNGIVNNWNVSTITNMSGLFRGAITFNRPLDTWNTSAVTDMSNTFYSAQVFNEPLDNWNTSSVTSMSGMFLGAGSFNQNINNWNVNQVTDMSGTFQRAYKFDFPLNNWNVTNVTNMANMFNTSAFNQPIANWNVSNVTNMSGMFGQSGMFDQGHFNQPIGNWDVSSVTDISGMFQNNRTFNHPLNSWDVSNVTNMSSVFDGDFGGQIYNQPLDNWNVSNVTDMSYMFRDNSAFNQDISGWDVSNVTDMRGMFSQTNVFNQDISDWNVSSVTNMSSMFQQAEVFNQPLNSWNVSSVTNMFSMFQQAEVFNQPLNSWNLGNVTSFQSMFNQATSFNQDISTWTTTSITNMSNMFRQATSFDQDLGSWDISGVANMTNMLSNSGISQTNYDAILIGWSGQTVNSSINLGATGLQYCDALNQRQSLIDNDGWTITGDSVNCSYVLCTTITMPRASDTETPANSDIRWDPAPNATGYRITVRRVNGPIDQLIYNNEDVGNVVGVDFTNEFTAGDTIYVTVVPYNNDGPATGCQEINFTVVESWVNSPDAFKLTYDTRLQYLGNTTPPNQLKIQTRSNLSYDYNIDWGDGQYDNHVTGDITHTYLTPGIYTVSIIGTFPAPKHEEFNSDAHKLLTIDQWGAQPWESMEGAFAGCENMEYNATDVPDLSGVTDMGRMFIVCKNFNGNINNWDVSNVTNMYGTFGLASIFNQPLDTWNVSNVTNMNFMFSGAAEFNQNIDSWNVGNVTDMGRMFSGATVFNQPLNSWNLSSATTTSQMFENASAFNQPLNAWNVAAVTDMSVMFHSAEAFNQNIDSWDVSNVTNMGSMFGKASAFNQPLNSWDVSSVTSMASMFNGASAFNRPLNNWNVGAVTNMLIMFGSATSFNQNIDIWNVTNVITMSYMFSNALVFNQPLNSWDVNSVVDMSKMFQGAEAFNQPLDSWNVSAVANMNKMFEDALIFNQPINTWNVSSVTLMESMFEGATAYNQPMDNWNVSVVTNFGAMFKNADAFDQPLNTWNTGEALTMAEMFYGASMFNQDINAWNTSFVTTMEGMFEDAVSYDQTMNSWNVASVTTLEKMFKGAAAFNGEINGWNVRGVATMREMFSGATTFNRSVNNWRVAGVSNMDYMFNNASAYNQAMDLWNLGNVSMRYAFYNATALNQDLSAWDVSGVSNMQYMLDNTALIRENYDNTLIAWSEQTLTSGITLGAEGLPYCDAQEERQSMIDTFGWTFSLDVRDCPIPLCTHLTSPLNGATDVPVNTNITWEATLFAQGYRLTVGTTPRGNDIENDRTITNDTSYEFPSDFNTGDVIYVTLIPFNDEGDAVGPCTEESFTISSDPATIPDCTTLTEPLNNATDVVVTTDLNWEPIANADGYRLTVGTTTGGNDIVANEDVGNVTEYDFATDLPEDQDIFVTLAPYNDQGDATGCTEESFHTEIIPVPPVCTNLISPANNATSVPIDTNLSWTAVANATGYLIIVGTTSGGIEVVNNIDVGNVTTYDIPLDLQEDRLHYVTIIPYNDEGDATGCIEETFTTGNSSSPPSCTFLTVPMNNATAVSTTTDLTWTASTSATGYRLSVGTTIGGTDIFIGDLGDVTTHDLATDLPESTIIYVTVTPYNVNGDAVGCIEESFTTDGPPLCTTLLSPANLATNVAVDTNIEWNASANADGYRLTITASSSTANNGTYDIATGTNLDLPNDFEQGETVQVTIVPYNEAGEAVGCTLESFTIGSVPPCTYLISPENNDVIAGVNQLTWNEITEADGYKITINAGSGTANNETDLIVTGTTHVFPNDFDQGGPVTVTIVPFNEVGDAVGCIPESFTIRPIPPCTSIVDSLNGATEVPVTTDISWNTSLGADGYRLSVGTTALGNDIVDNEDVASLTSYTFAQDLPSESLIYVTIVPYNTSGDAVGCSSNSFETEVVVPTCSALMSPENGEIEVNLESPITWEEVEKTDGYRISIGTTGGGNDIVDNLDMGTLTSYNHSGKFPFDTEIFVTITPYNVKGDAVGCEQQSFTTLVPEDNSKYGFSPDGDGINEYWHIENIEYYPENIVTIYNRWGDAVFRIENYDNGSKVFRGEANLKTKMGAGRLPSGTYFFDIQIEGETILKKTKGFVVIKR